MISTIEKDTVAFDNTFEVHCTLSIIEYLFSNLHVTMLPNDSSVSAEKITDSSWRGNVFGLQGSVFLDSYHKDPYNNTGTFYYKINTSWLLLPIDVIAVANYKRISNTKFLISGGVNYKLRSVFKLVSVKRLFRVHRGVDLLKSYVKYAYDNLFKDFDRYIEVLPSEEQEKLKESKHLLLKPNYDYYNKEVLNSILSELEGKFSSTILNNIHTSVKLIDTDPNLCLTNNRKLLEKILRYTLNSKNISVPEKSTTGLLLDLLSKEKDVPDKVLKEMKYISEFGAYGAHVGSSESIDDDYSKDPFEIDTNEAIVSTISVCQVLKWFFTFIDKYEDREFQESEDICIEILLKGN